MIQESRMFGTTKSGETVAANTTGQQRCREAGPLPAYSRLVKEGKIRKDAHQLTALNVLQKVSALCIPEHCWLTYACCISDDPLLLSFCLFES